MKEILISGANGKLGAKLFAHYLARGWQPKALVRNQVTFNSVDVLPELDIKGLIPKKISFSDFGHMTSGADALIHTAALTPKRNVKLKEFIGSNSISTYFLAKKAGDRKIKTFVYISTSQVYGSNSKLGQPFKPSCKLDPKNSYATSKALGEVLLAKISKDYPEMKIIILRVPLIYHERAGGVLGLLLFALKYRIPLPLGGFDGKWSMISLDKLLDVLVRLVDAPVPGSCIVNCSDGFNESIKEFAERMSNGRGSDRCNIDITGFVRNFFDFCGWGNPLDRYIQPFELDTDTSIFLSEWEPDIDFLLYRRSVD